MFNDFQGVRVFSATKAKEREELGEHITDWISRHPEFEITNCEVRQSSDQEFHCISIILFFKPKKQEG